MPEDCDWRYESHSEKKQSPLFNLAKLEKQFLCPKIDVIAQLLKCSICIVLFHIATKVTKNNQIPFIYINLVSILPKFIKIQGI